ncbi:MAG: nickel-dependent hydrogenase large subunit [Gallionella sp.]|nr:nickel-dependent hydrogenase large subunit [Gallionella sp.]
MTWDGASVGSVDVRSTRPQASVLLKGKTPAQVMQLVPLLFSVCGHAQGAAAESALRAARQIDPGDAQALDRKIRSEVLQEHLWRMLLDWPKALGLPQQEKLFMHWHAMLRRIASGDAGTTRLRLEFERDWLGVALADWRELDDVRAWWRSTQSPAARLLAALDEQACCMRNTSALLSAWSAAQAQIACAGRWSTAFAAAPDDRGGAAETGAWSYHADHRMLGERYSNASKRLLARLIDTVKLLDENAAPRLDAIAPAAGEGIAVARTARGLLMHHVQLEAERVTEYSIVAPTEWNFHPGGAFVQDMVGLEERDEASLRRRAHIAALSLDPCVAFEIEVRHA